MLGGGQSAPPLHTTPLPLSYPPLTQSTPDLSLIPILAPPPQPHPLILYPSNWPLTLWYTSPTPCTVVSGLLVIPLPPYNNSSLLRSGFLSDVLWWMGRDLDLQMGYDYREAPHNVCVCVKVWWICHRRYYTQHVWFITNQYVIHQPLIRTNFTI